jgi:hypothetical protein
MTVFVFGNALVKNLISQTKNLLDNTLKISYLIPAMKKELQKKLDAAQAAYAGAAH